MLVILTLDALLFVPHLADSLRHTRVNQGNILLNNKVATLRKEVNNMEPHLHNKVDLNKLGLTNNFSKAASKKSDSRAYINPMILDSTPTQVVLLLRWISCARNGMYRERSGKTL